MHECNVRLSPNPPGDTIPLSTPREAVKGFPDVSDAGSFTPAAVFREMMTQLVDEYERMQADLIRLGGEDALQRLPILQSHPCLPLGASDPSAFIDPPQQQRPYAPPKDACLPSAPQEILVSKKLSSAITRVSSSGVDCNRTPALFLARSRRFQRFIGLVITLNMVLLGITSDLEMSEAQAGELGTSLGSVQIIETVFFVTYFVELAIRLSAFGKRFFTSKYERNWNIFDTLLVVQGAFEQVVAYVSIGNFTLSGRLRAVRLVKMIKMMRALRLMRSMRELRMILSAFTGSVRSMLWSLILLISVVYMFALIFVNGMVDYMHAAGDGIKEDEFNGILLYWGSVPTAMETLFKSCTGGMDWEVAMAPLNIAGAEYSIVFMIFISFFIFVILNIVTALFVENTMAKASKDVQSTIHFELEKKQEYKKSLAVLFSEIDEDQDGEVSLDEFTSKIEDARFQAFFAALDIEVLDATHFFKLISEGGTKTVTLDQFVASCTRMRGNALAIDLHELICMQSLAQKEVYRLISTNDQEFRSLRAALETSLAAHFRALETRLRVALVRPELPRSAPGGCNAREVHAI